MLQRTIKCQTAYYTHSLLFWYEILFKYLFLRFSRYFWIFMVPYIFPFLKHFLSVRTLETNDVNHIAEKMHLLLDLSLLKLLKTFISHDLLKQSNYLSSKWKCYSQHWKWHFPSSWNYLIWATLNRIILKKKITKLNHLQIILIYRNS